MSGHTGTVGRRVKASCLTKLDDKTEEAYQENFRKTVHNLYRPVDLSCSPPSSYDERHQIPINDNINELRQINLPELSKKVKSLYLSMDPRKSKDDPNSWYKTIINNVTKIAKVLDSVEVSLADIWHYDPSSVSRERLLYIKASQTQIRLEDLQAAKLSPFLLACRDFFDDVSIVNVSIHDNRAIIKKWRKNGKLASLLIDDINTTIEWLAKSNLDVAKQEWHKTVEQIEDLLTSLTTHRNQIYQNFGEVYRSTSKDRHTILKATGIELVQLSVSVLESCRVYFTKLSGSASSQPLFFNRPLTEIEVKRLNKFERQNRLIGDQIKSIVDKLRSPTINPREVLDGTNALVRSMIKSQHKLRKYWNSTLLTDDIETDDEAIKKAFEWLDRWGTAFFLATGKLMKATGLPFTWPSFDQGLDSSAEKLDYCGCECGSDCGCAPELGSRPAIDGVDSLDSVVRFGPEGGRVYQKAFVKFFIPKSHLEGLPSAVEYDNKDFFQGTQSVIFLGIHETNL
ncbi:hypothetical protein MJO28_007859 [Puccinia striiformis f. sp. tritici]|uniref:Uncharacterized protein n=1 Tax=Puccinia striiformis f. sp. tritici TaxID=168172 RepID=A0ACC0EGE8_9BASI|nr:hypothetical protein MJO28_007859 [Puccinia striiformis f. sp. tritici]KAI7956406.1 hypothetical protein MJO29_007805 [Puccinia striiformis f. sp. tritici]